MSEKGEGDNPSFNPEAPIKPKPGFIGWIVGHLKFNETSPRHLEDLSKMRGVNIENTGDGVRVSVHTMVSGEGTKKKAT